MDEPRTYDVIVVGAGVAGAAVARELSCLDLAVLVLEAGKILPAVRRALTRLSCTRASIPIREV